MLKSNRNRSRRLRKKLHIGEFQECGFEVVCTPTLPNGLAIDDLIDRWLGFVNEKDWCFGGSIGLSSIEGFVTTARQGTLHEEDRRLCEEWLNKQEWIESSKVGPLRDAWHD